MNRKESLMLSSSKTLDTFKYDSISTLEILRNPKDRLKNRIVRYSVYLFLVRLQRFQENIIGFRRKNFKLRSKQKTLIVSKLCLSNPFLNKSFLNLVEKTSLQSVLVLISCSICWLNSHQQHQRER